MFARLTHVLATCLVVFAIVSCSKQESEPTVDAEATQMAQKASRELISSFQKDLKGELMSAMKEGGPSHAIGVCQMRAPEIAADASKENVITLRRVSDLYRNPENEADSHESLILNTFAHSGDQPPAHYDEWVTVDSIEHYRFYKPIYVQELCLQCHGTEKTVDDATSATINSLYPQDKAKGYEVGDLRGMFVVDMTWPEAKEIIQDMESDSL